MKQNVQETFRLNQEEPEEHETQRATKMQRKGVRKPVVRASEGEGREEAGGYIERSRVTESRRTGSPPAGEA